MRALLFVFSASLLANCTAIAPSYQPTNENIRLLQQGGADKLRVGDFSEGENGEPLGALSIRGRTYASPYNDSFANYLREALRSELAAAGRLSDSARVTVSGVLLAQSLDTGIATGTSSISARFKLIRDQQTLYDKVLAADYEWESSFVGLVAIPRAYQSYPALMQKLLARLYADTDFETAVKAGRK